MPATAAQLAALTGLGFAAAADVGEASAAQVTRARVPRLGSERHESRWMARRFACVHSLTGCPARHTAARRDVKRFFTGRCL